MALKVVSTSDTHLGLKTDEIDRNPEIVEIMCAVVEKAIEHKKEGHDVILILGGDLFDNNTPSEKDISCLLTVFHLIKLHDIKTYVLLGNHEAVSDPDRLSCLGWIRKAKVGYPMITLVDDIKFIKVGDFDNGPLYFTFLPHITKGTVELNKRKEEYLEARTTQEYIEMKAKKILKKVAKGSQHYVFSHLNVHGAHPGSEENLLKKSEVFLPKVFTNPPAGFVKPTIIQYHIHCLDQDSELLTVDGWKRYDQINTSDLCYGYDIETGSLHETPVLEVIKSKFEGELNYSGGNLEYGMTDNHRVIYTSKKIMKVTPFSEITNSVLKIPVSGQIESADYPIDDLKLKLLVWIFSDGGYSQFDNRLNGIKFSFKKERKIKRLGDLLSKLSNSYTKIETKEGVTIFRIISEDYLFQWALDILGTEKELPNFFTKLSKRQVDLVLVEMSHSDGNYTHPHKNKKWIQFSTSKKLSRDIIQQMLVINNVKCGWWETKSCPGHWGIAINIGKTLTETRRDKYTREYYKGDVWCIRNTYGTFVARKNGKTFITGNSQQTIDNIHIIGSPIFCGFGEQGPKYYADITIATDIGKKDDIKLVQTAYRPFHQLELDMMGSTTDFFDLPELEEFWQLLATDAHRKPIAKINVTINAENNTYNWAEIRKKIMRLLEGVYVKPIDPRVIPLKTVRSEKQKISLKPDEAVKVYLNKNITNDKSKKKRIYQKSKKYLGME